MSRPSKHRQKCKVCGTKLGNPTRNKTGLCKTCFIEKKKSEGHISEKKKCVKCGAEIYRGNKNVTGLCKDCYYKADNPEHHLTLLKDERKRKAIKAYEDTGGNISAAVAIAGVTRHTWNQWRFKDADFAEKATAVEEKIADYVEAKLLAFIKKNNVEATIFYLKTKVKHRGYFTYATQKVQMEAEIKIMEKTEQEIEGMSDTALIAEIIK